MAKIQELQINEQEILPPRKMKAVPIYFMNRSMVRLLEVLSTHLFWASVAGSNNTSGTCGTADMAEFKDSWKQYLKLKESVKKSHSGPNPTPDGALDTHLAVLIPDPYEKVRFYNQCWKQPCMAIFNLIDVYAAHDARGLASEIQDWVKIEAAEKAVDVAIEDFFGKDAIKPTAKVKLGRLSPPADFHYEVKLEAGADRPRLGYADQPDRNIEVNK